MVKLASRPMPEGRKIGKGSGPSLPSFQLFDPLKRPRSPCASENSAGLSRASTSSRMIPGFQPCFPHPGPWLNPRCLPMAGSMQRAFTAASRPSSQPLRTFHAQAKRFVRLQERRKAWHMGSEDHVAAPLRPSAGLPQEAHSRCRRGPRRVRLARLGGDESPTPPEAPIIRLRTNVNRFHRGRSYAQRSLKRESVIVQALTPPRRPSPMQARERAIMFEVVAFSRARA